MGLWQIQRRVNVLTTATKTRHQLVTKAPPVISQAKTQKAVPKCRQSLFTRLAARLRAASHCGWTFPMNGQDDYSSAVLRTRWGNLSFLVSVSKKTAKNRKDSPKITKNITRITMRLLCKGPHTPQARHPASREFRFPR